MTELRALRPPAWFYISFGMGMAAASTAILPGPRWAAVLLAPVALVALWLWTTMRADTWTKAFLCSALLLPPLPIVLGNSGPHPALLFAALGLFAGLLRIREWRIAPGYLTAALLLFFFVLLLSAGMAALYSGPAIAAGTLARVFLLGISVYLFLYTAYGPGARAHPAAAVRLARVLFWCGVGSALFACADFYFQFPAPAGFGPQFVWLDSGVYRRAQGVFYEASTLGNVCAFFLVMIAVAFRRPKEFIPISRAALLTGGCVFAAALVFSYSRASVGNVVLSLGALVWLERSRLRGRRRTWALAGALAAGSALSYWIFPAFSRLYWNRLSGSMLGFFTNTEGILTGRLESWRLLAGFLAEHPWRLLAGIGYKTLPYTHLTGAPVVADNMYLSILVETGVIGLSAMLLLNVAILAAAYRAARHPAPAASFFGAWIFCFWIGQLFQMLSGDLLTYWRVLPLYFWVLATAVREAAARA